MVTLRNYNSTFFSGNHTVTDNYHFCRGISLIMAVLESMSWTCKCFIRKQESKWNTQKVTKWPASTESIHIFVYWQHWHRVRVRSFKNLRSLRNLRSSFKDDSIFIYIRKIHVIADPLRKHFSVAASSSCRDLLFYSFHHIISNL